MMSPAGSHPICRIFLNIVMQCNVRKLIAENTRNKVLESLSQTTTTTMHINSTLGNSNATLSSLWVLQIKSLLFAMAKMWRQDLGTWISPENGREGCSHRVQWTRRRKRLMHSIKARAQSSPWNFQQPGFESVEPRLANRILLRVAHCGRSCLI